MNLNSSQTAYLSGPRLSTAKGMQTEHPIKVLLIGATGFIGSRILQALQVRNDVLVSILARRSTDFFPAPQPTILLGDVTDPASVRAAVRYSDVVINAASYVGAESKLAEDVNHQGTLSVIQACESSDVRRFVQISTTAVYGSGPHRALSISEAQFGPESSASRSRAEADRAVLSVGGIVVRPNLIHGAGDRWFIPGAVRMFKTLGTTIENGRALLSTIDVTDLGLLIASLAVTSAPVAGAYHASYQTPLSLARLLGTIDQHLTPLNIDGNSTVQQAVSNLELAGFTPHHIHMMGLDHHYESQKLWDIAGIPSTEFQLSSEAQAWYRDTLAAK